MSGPIGNMGGPPPGLSQLRDIGLGPPGLATSPGQNGVDGEAGRAGAPGAVSSSDGPGSAGSERSGLGDGSLPILGDRASSSPGLLNGSIERPSALDRLLSSADALARFRPDQAPQSGPPVSPTVAAPGADQRAGDILPGAAVPARPPVSIVPQSAPAAVRDLPPVHVQALPAAEIRPLGPGNLLGAELSARVVGAGAIADARLDLRPTVAGAAANPALTGGERSASGSAPSPATGLATAPGAGLAATAPNPPPTLPADASARALGAGAFAFVPALSGDLAPLLFALAPPQGNTGAWPVAPPFSERWSDFKERLGHDPARIARVEAALYDILAARFAAAGVDLARRSAALRDTVWAIAVEHGPWPAPDGSDVLTQVAARRHLPDLADAALIRALFDERTRKDQAGGLVHYPELTIELSAVVARRLEEEQRVALARLGVEA